MSENEGNLNLFVYGSLMSGFELNRSLALLKFEPAILEDYVRLKAGHTLVLKKKGHVVVGELYKKVPNDIFEYIIGLEHGYRPIAVTVKTFDGKEVVATIFYCHQDFRLEMAERKYKRIHIDKKEEDW